MTRVVSYQLLKDSMVVNFVEMMWCFVRTNAFVIATSSRKVKM